jgi:hypothetical protein
MESQENKPALSRWMTLTPGGRPTGCGGSAECYECKLALTGDSHSHHSADPSEPVGLPPGVSVIQILVSVGRKYRTLEKYFMHGQWPCHQEEGRFAQGIDQQERFKPRG